MSLCDLFFCFFFHPHCREVALGVAEDSSLSKFCLLFLYNKEKNFLFSVCVVGSYLFKQLLKRKT